MPRLGYLDELKPLVRGHPGVDVTRSALHSFGVPP